MKSLRRRIACHERSSCIVRRATSGIALGISILLLSFASLARIPKAATPASARKQAPDFSLRDANGMPIRLADFKGRVVVLDFWATWCHGCKLEIPWFMEFEDRYGQKGLSVIGVSMDDDGWKAVKPFIAAKKMNYTVVIGDDALAKQYGLGPMPMTVLIDRNGRIADSHSGVVDKAKWESEIRSLLAESSGIPSN